MSCSVAVFTVGFDVVVASASESPRARLYRGSSFRRSAPSDLETGLLEGNESGITSIVPTPGSLSRSTTAGSTYCPLESTTIGSTSSFDSAPSSPRPPTTTPSTPGGARPLGLPVLEPGAFGSRRGSFRSPASLTDHDLRNLLEDDEGASSLLSSEDEGVVPAKEEEGTTNAGRRMMSPGFMQATTSSEKKRRHRNRVVHGLWGRELPELVQGNNDAATSAGESKTKTDFPPLPPGQSTETQGEWNKLKRACRKKNNLRAPVQQTSDVLLPPWEDGLLEQVRRKEYEERREQQERDSRIEEKKRLEEEALAEKARQQEADKEQQRREEDERKMEEFKATVGERYFERMMQGADFGKRFAENARKKLEIFIAKKNGQRAVSFEEASCEEY